ncbi:MAG TPA: SRPBCC family protein [Candidatus Obscuribacterales bacterium]
MNHSRARAITNGAKHFCLALLVFFLANSSSLAGQIEACADPAHNMGAGATEDAAQDKTPTSVKPKKGQNLKLAESSIRFTIKATPERVWATLCNFDVYPAIFKRVKRCQVTRRDGDLVYVETFLKPQMFVRETCQHTVNNLSAKPEKLEWSQIDGNFKHLDGSWTLKPVNDGKNCEVVYTLHVDAGSIVPSPLVSFLLKFVQKEIANQLCAYVQQTDKKAALTASENHI